MGWNTQSCIIYLEFIIPLDFKKAFDSLEWGFIMNALDILNFGPSIKRWISAFCTNIESAVISNGFLTNW